MRISSSHICNTDPADFERLAEWHERAVKEEEQLQGIYRMSGWQRLRFNIWRKFRPQAFRRWEQEFKLAVDARIDFYLKRYRDLMKRKGIN